MQTLTQALVLPVSVLSTVSSALASALRNFSRTLQPLPVPRQSNFEFIVLGSGVSTGIPRINCIIDPTRHCAVCTDANENPLGKNRRCNVSAIVRIGTQCVLIDCGKTIREAIMRWGPQYGIETVNAIALTHGHADAMLGLDDLRDIQRKTRKYDAEGRRITILKDGPTPIFLNEETMTVCRRAFPYLAPLPEDDPSIHTRRVSKINWNVYKEQDYFKPFRPLKDSALTFTPVPLYHGGDYICMGYIIRSHDENNAIIAYLSDVSLIPEKTMKILQSEDKIDLLVIDALQHRKIYSHFSLNDAIDLAKKLRPTRTLCCGMSCEMGLHDKVNKELAKLRNEENLWIELSHDGLRVSF